MCIKKKHTTKIINIPELNLLLENHSKYFDKKVISKADLFNSFIAYLDWVLNYTQSVFKGKSISYDNIATILFNVDGFKNNCAYNEFLKKNLYAVQIYITALKSNLDIKFVDRYNSLILTTCCETNFAIVEYEKSISKASIITHHTLGRRKDLSTTDMWFAMNELLFIENSDFSKFDYRDIKPNTMFIIRQFLEQLWQNVIGYSKIIDCNNNAPIKKFTQIAWQFIASKNNNNQANWHIDIPLNTQTISAVNNWANSFVHNTYIYDSHIQYMAMLIIRELIRPPKSYIRCFTDTEHPSRKASTSFGDIQITNYYNLKADFENEIKHRMANARVEWFDNINKVGAYIITVGDANINSRFTDYMFAKDYVLNSIRELWKAIICYFKTTYKLLLSYLVRN